jgi:hypothetical protein
LKKFLAIAVSVLFLLGFAASAFAIHAEIPSETQAVVAKGETQVTLGGSIRVRGEIRQNTTDLNDDLQDSMSWYDQRVRLSAGIKVSDDVTGLLMLESNGGGSDGYTWGSSNGAAGAYGVGNGKPTDMHINQAWINYTNDLINVKIGHMPLALGNKLFFDHRKFGDDAIVLYKDIDNIHIAGIVIKLSEGLVTTADICAVDLVNNLTGIAPPDGIPDVPIVLALPAAGACPVGTVAIDTSSAVDTAGAGDANGYVGLVAYKGDGYNISGDITWVDDNANTTDLYNLGVRADAKLSDLVTIRGDIEFQFGEASATVDLGGYAGMLGADFDLENFDIGVEVGIGSGDDPLTLDENEGFINSLSSGVPYITFVRGTRTGALGDNLGISNLTYLKATVKASPMDKMDVKGAVVYMLATEEPIPGGDDDIGIEIDASMHYSLAKNLKYWVEGGYLMAGDAYGANTDDAYALRHGIEMSF